MKNRSNYCACIKILSSKAFLLLHISLGGSEQMLVLVGSTSVTAGMQQWPAEYSFLENTAVRKTVSLILHFFFTQKLLVTFGHQTNLMAAHGSVLAIFSGKNHLYVSIFLNLGVNVLNICRILLKKGFWQWGLTVVSGRGIWQGPLAMAMFYYGTNFYKTVIYNVLKVVYHNF